MCSDLSPVPIARAVLASSAFPVAFTPVTLKNYGAAPCGYWDPIWVGEALQDFYGVRAAPFSPVAARWKALWKAAALRCSSVEREPDAGGRNAPSAGLGRHGRRGREDSEAPRMLLVLAIEIEEQLGGADAQQRGAHDVGEPVCAVAHTAESVEQRERVNRDRDVPFVVVVLAHAGRQGEHRRHITEYQRLSPMKERGMAGALGRSQPAKRGFDPDVNERRDARTLAGGERVLTRARVPL